MKRLKILIVFAICSLMAMAQTIGVDMGEESRILRSPNENVFLMFNIANGKPYYRVAYKHTRVIHDSFPLLAYLLFANSNPRKESCITRVCL